jgi:hypothetical protein
MTALQLMLDCADSLAVSCDARGARLGETVYASMGESLFLLLVRRHACEIANAAKR